MLVVAVTGGIGSGKSTVAAQLGRRGALVIDADALARKVLAPGGAAEAAVLAAFGPAVTGPDGHVDRSALAALVFTDEAARRSLEQIVHPLVHERAVAAMAQRPKASVIVYDVPLLVETQGQHEVDVVVVVEASLTTRLARLRARGVDDADARARIAAQADDADRRAVAHEVLRNDGSLAQLLEATDRLWTVLQQRAADLS